MAIRTFEILTARGWQQLQPHQIAPRDTFRVLDDSVVTGLAPDAALGDPLAYVAAQTSANGVHFPVGLVSGTVERVAGFTA